MPSTYTLRAQTNWSAAEVASFLGHVEGFRAKDGRLSGPGLSSVEVRREDGFGQQLIRDAFGSTPDIVISFEVEKFEGYESGLASVATAWNAWLRHQAGDTVLLLNSEQVVAIRTRGRVIL